MTIKKIVITIIVVLLVGILSWFAYDFLFLRVIGTTPQKDTIATTTPYMRFEFNKEIASVGTVKFSEQNATSHIEGKSIRVDIPYNSLYENTTYMISLSNIVSKDSKKLASYIFDFSAKYVDSNKQPVEIQKALVDKSNSGQSNDPFLLLPFPMGTTEDLPFFLSATVDPAISRPLINVTFIDEIKTPENPNPQVSNARADELYAQVIKYIKDKGGTPKNYDLFFSNTYLNAKTGMLSDY